MKPSPFQVSYEFNIIHELFGIGFEPPVNDIITFDSFNLRQHVPTLRFCPLRLELLLLVELGVFFKFVDLLLDCCHVNIIHACFVYQKLNLWFLGGCKFV